MPSNTGQIAAKYGLGWGGNWKTVKDAMHFSIAKSEGGSVAIDRSSDPGITSDKSSSSSYTPAPSPANTGAIPPAATNVDTSNLSQPTGSSSSGGLGSTTGGNVPTPISSTSGGGLGSTTGGNVPAPMSNVGSSFMSGLSSMAGGNISSQLSSAGSSFISGLGATFGGNVPAPMSGTSGGGLGATFGGSIPTPMSGTSAGGLGSTTGGNIPAPMSGTSAGGLNGKVTTNTPVSTKQSGMMKQVYDSFKNAGFSDNQARALTAEVGRENDFNAKNVFGSHIDPKNNAVNLGFFSWQGSRGKKLQQYLTERGLMQDGKIVQSQESLNAMAQFSKQEMESGGYKGMDKFLNNPNVDRDTASQILGKKYIKWRHDDPAYAHHHTKRNKYYDQLGGFATQIDPKQSNAPGSMPGSNVAGTPGSMPGSNVAGAPGSMPGSTVAGAPGSMPGSTVAGAPGQQPSLPSNSLFKYSSVDDYLKTGLGGGRMGDRWGPRSGYGSKNHQGIDLRPQKPGGTMPIKPIGDGEVIESKNSGAYGNTVVVKHADGTTTRYAHLANLDVKVGQKVDSNTKLGMMGSTGRSRGNHLHFEMKDQSGKKINPDKYFEQQRQLAAQNPNLLQNPNQPQTPNQPQNLNQLQVAGQQSADPSTWQMSGQQIAANAPSTRGYATTNDAINAGFAEGAKETKPTTGTTTPPSKEATVPQSRLDAQTKFGNASTTDKKQTYATANDAINAGFAEGAKETKPTTGTTTPQVLSTQEARNKIVSKLQDPNLSEEERAKWASSIPALNEADRRMEEAKQPKPETGVTSPPSKEDVDLESQLQTTVNEAQTENQLQDAVNIPSPTGTSSGPPSSVSSESTGSGTTQQPSYNEQPTSQQMQQPQQPSNPLESAAQGFLSTLQGLMGMTGMPGMSGNMFGGQMMGGFNKPNIMSPFQSLAGTGANLMGQGFNAISQGVNNLFSGGSEIALTPPQAQFDVQNATSSTIQTAAETDMMRSDMVGQAVSGSLAQDSSGMVDPGSLSPDSELQPRHYPTNLSGGGSGFSKDDMTTTPVDPLGDDIALRLFNLLSPSLFYSAKNQAMETKQNNYVENIFI